MNETRFDVAVIGGGPGGYVAAIRAAQLGMKTALIEREHLGGICSNWGCIPTKALLHAASLYRQMRHAHAFGLHVEGLSVDLPQLIEGSRKVAGRMNDGVRHLLKKNKVALLEGEGGLLSGGQIEIANAAKARTVIGAAHIILATGARPRDIPVLPVDGDRVWNYRHALLPRALPESLIVIGAGAIGMEFASFYSTLSCKVTVIEAQQRVLPAEDKDISEFVRTAFEKQGVSIHTGATVTGVEKSGRGLTISLQRDGNTDYLVAQHALVSVGVTGNTEGLGLENTRVKIEGGHIVVDAQGRTGEPGVYAVGDVAGPPWLAHKASHEAVLCVENIANPGHPTPLDATRIPGCVYSHPQVASIGLTEEQAARQGYTMRIGRFPFAGNGKATVLGDIDGFIKTIFDAATGELLGAHLAGAEVTELIHGFAIAKTLEATEFELMHTIFPHPTLSEAAHESVLMAFDLALHI
jgi:dihydrolipoamide dehydrogenase